MSFHICQPFEELTVPSENWLVSLVVVDFCIKNKNYLTSVKSLCNSINKKRFRIVLDLHWKEGRY